jgi:phage/plasmid-associated DNA primase
LVLYTNHLPKVGATDEGTWRRLIVIPFNAVFEGRSDVKNYADYLFENAGPAVLSWIIEGAKRIISKDFHLKNPKVVQDAIDAYRGQNDWMSEFLEECCEVDPSYREKSGELYLEYRAYCTRIGEYARSTTDFYSAVEKAGFVRRKTRSGIMVHGLSLKEGQDFLD